MPPKLEMPATPAKPRRRLPQPTDRTLVFMCSLWFLAFCGLLWAGAYVNAYSLTYVEAAYNRGVRAGFAHAQTLYKVAKDQSKVCRLGEECDDAK